MPKRKEFSNRKRIFSKACHRCEVCNCDNNLHIHHRDFDNSNSSPDNARVVCGDCHRDIHIAKEEARANHITEVRRKDLETEQKMKATWVRIGRSLDEIGGEESAKFFSDYLLRGVTNEHH